MVVMNLGFSVWLDKELSDRGWSQSEAARRGEISSQMINAVVNGQANPGLDFCKGISRALKIPLEDVFRLAGILPTRAVRERRRIVYEVHGEDLAMALWRALRPEDQELVRDLMERLAAPVAPRIIGDEEQL